jgi:hypothetical protein
LRLDIVSPVILVYLYCNNTLPGQQYSVHSDPIIINIYKQCPAIDRQSYPYQLERYGTTYNKKLNYEAINNNKIIEELWATKLAYPPHHLFTMPVASQESA